MFGIGMSELIIILAVALLVFGPQKLPEIARTIAKGMRELRRAGDDLRSSIDVDDSGRAHRVARRDTHLDEAAAHIPGSELAAAPAAAGAAAAPPPWPQAADGTQPIGSLPSDAERPASPEPPGGKEA